jgi:deazaflavin-dependent oxidoreductase (nitroreductase family)
MAYRIGLGSVIGKFVLLLTTTGRKSGLARTTPLQYELIDGIYHVGAVFGAQADWARNIMADPHVQLQVGNRCITGVASVSTDPDEITDFVQYRLGKYPRMIGVIMRLDGFKTRPTREELLAYSQDLALVRIRPLT